MCNKTMFRELRNLSEPQQISLGDGHVLQAIGLEMLLPDGSSQKCRYGHLGEKNLRKLAKEKLVQQFCEACVGRKHQYGQFENSKTQMKEKLELVHSDGKMRHKSIGRS